MSSLFSLKARCCSDSVRVDVIAAVAVVVVADVVAAFALLLRCGRDNVVAVIVLKHNPSSSERARVTHISNSMLRDHHP